jgi:hypothetical protein
VRKWAIPERFVKWYNRREEEDDIDNGETQKNAVAFLECRDSDFEEDTPGPSQSSQNVNKRKVQDETFVIDSEDDDSASTTQPTKKNKKRKVK